MFFHLRNLREQGQNTDIALLLNRNDKLSYLSEIDVGKEQSLVQRNWHGFYNEQEVRSQGYAALAVSINYFGGHQKVESISNLISRCFPKSRRENNRK